MPYAGFLSTPFVNGNKVQIDGMVLPQARAFEVNLKTTDGQTYLLVNPRFEQDALVLNSNIASNGGWGQEEQMSGLPKGIRRGAGFSLTVRGLLDSMCVRYSPGDLRARQILLDKIQKYSYADRVAESGLRGFCKQRESA